MSDFPAQLRNLIFESIRDVADTWDRIAPANKPFVLFALACLLIWRGMRAKSGVWTVLLGFAGLFAFAYAVLLLSGQAAN